ncbi:GNVR domain-containing protein [Winogradskyella sp.]|uniref:GNVR domain-containing protein n=1 Tax=Winogradskyella sp. TaxID=1883156 RepID=UPI003AB42E26
MKEEKKIPFDKDETTKDVFEIIKGFWVERRFILRTTLLFTFIGLFIAVFSKNQYTSYSTFAPLMQGKSVNSGLGGLASLAGINLNGGNSSDISPDLYPQIIRSIPFQKELLQTPLLIEGQSKPVTYEVYYDSIYRLGVLGNLKKYTLGLPSVIVSMLNNNQSKKNSVLNDSLIISLTVEEGRLIRQLESQINLAVNTDEGFVTISVTMPEAYASSQLTLRAQELLQEYVLNFKTQKSKDQLNYIEARFLEKQKEFQDIKIRFARFQDQNNSINTALGKTQFLELESEYELAFSVYNELAKQLETQRLQVKQDTPVFTVLKPVTKPMEKSAPKKFLTLVVFVLLGLLVSFGFVLAKHFYIDLKKHF